MGRLRQIPRLVAGLIAATALLASSCASPPKTGAESVRYSYGADDGDERRPVSQVELQQDVERFVSVFLDRLNQVADETGPLLKPGVRVTGMRQMLLYASSMLEIATEPTPEVALLDMLVFVTLNQDAIERHWIPKVLGPEAEPLLAAFRKAETEIWAIADKVSNDKQQALVRSLIREWQAENPDQYRVEGVRLGTFSQAAGRIAKDRARSAGGLLSSVSAAVEKADEALLLGERAMFLAQRMPSLIRLQARLGFAQILTDLNTQALIGGSSAVLQKATLAASEGTEFAKSLYPLVLPVKGQLTQNLATLDRISDKTLAMLNVMSASEPAERVDRVLRRATLYLVAAGVALIAAFWFGYYLFRRAHARAEARDRASREPPSRGGRAA